MTKVAIVYFSATGNTKLMAEAVAEGANSVADTEAQLLRITGEQIDAGRWQDEAVIEALNAADAIVIGTPTYMGGVAAQLKAFIDAAGAIWMSQGWKNKIAGGFTHSGSPSGDKQGTLLYLATNAAQHGMVWVGFAELANEEGVNRVGSFLGAMGYGRAAGEVDPGDIKSSQLYGQRLAKATHAWGAAEMT
ncbi:MAG: flavodoxin family protein [Cyanobacteria bacterium P01_D01_bin.105]